MKRFGIQTFLVILVEEMAMDDGVALYQVLEMSLVILVTRKLGPPWRTLLSIAVLIRAVMSIQSRHGILYRVWMRSGRFDNISSHGAHCEIF